MNREAWKTRDRRMRMWGSSQRAAWGRREIAYLRSRAYYRDLPSRRSKVDVIGYRQDGSTPDQLIYSKDLRDEHVEWCRSRDFDPVLLAEFYLARIRRASCPLVRIP